ncbi:MAG: LuxR C-terminal-related transcriptional regulator [Allosphingosinicella sp.]
MILYALALALAAAALEWLRFRHFAFAFPTELYVVLIAAGFAGLGLWAGRKLTPRPAPAVFERNAAAAKSLGLTPRECELLELLASGRSNKELARDLGISPNTVKTHLARLFEKLEARNRIEAIETGRRLALIP